MPWVFSFRFFNFSKIFLRMRSVAKIQHYCIEGDRCVGECAYWSTVHEMCTTHAFARTSWILP